VTNFKKHLEKEQKNLMAGARSGEVKMPTIQELLEFDTTGIKKGMKKTS
jgi:hypothetical protein